MMYIFPRQFKLHNVFTSAVDRKQTAQRFQDYTLREGEIASHMQGSRKETDLPKIPRRLRGTAKHLVRRLQVRHGRCSYHELLRHYCPSVCDTGPSSHSPAYKEPASLAKGARAAPRVKARQPQHPSHSRRVSGKTQSQYQPSPLSTFDSVTEFACPTAHVSAFCQAVLSKIIPNGFWGEGDTMEHNKKQMRQKVDHFIKLRRFEAMSLHEIIQDFKAIFNLEFFSHASR